MNEQLLLYPLPGFKQTEEIKYFRRPNTRTVELIFGYLLLLSYFQILISAIFIFQLNPWIFFSSKRLGKTFLSFGAKKITKNTRSGIF